MLRAAARLAAPAVAIGATPTLCADRWSPRSETDRWWHRFARAPRAEGLTYAREVADDRDMSWCEYKYHTTITRTPRCRRLVSRREACELARLINLLVDIEGLHEEHEQEIFEFAVIRVLNEVAEALPDAYLEFATRQHHLKWQHLEISRDHTDALCQRLMEHARRRCSLPFLDAADEARVIGAVVVIVSHAMLSGNTIGLLCSPSSAHTRHLVVDVLLKGVMARYFDPAERESMIKAVTVNIKNIPFVPLAIVEHAIDSCVQRVGLHIEAAARDAFRATMGEWSPSGGLPTLLSDADARAEIRALLHDDDAPPLERAASGEQLVHPEWLPPSRYASLGGEFTSRVRLRLFEILLGEVAALAPPGAARASVRRAFASSVLDVVDEILSTVPTRKFEDSVCQLKHAVKRHGSYLLVEKTPQCAHRSAASYAREIDVETRAAGQAEAGRLHARRSTMLAAPRRSGLGAS